ncbi:Imm17 family immunity protein [Fusobacterium russii]|uniref:Imm17 family immunity protein n=1 Tax=Fusobacterium russii TaxID=854 RepID=UPI0003A7D8CA|nr:Imm17 family immunity protein [Fusobacterium russii]
MDEKIGSWIKNNPNIFGKIVAIVFFIFGICLIIGAFKDWDWLYAPDKEYHSRWSMGQLSRYYGRKTARFVGFLAGIAITIFGCILIYGAFFR